MNSDLKENWVFVNEERFCVICMKLAHQMVKDSKFFGVVCLLSSYGGGFLLSGEVYGDDYKHVIRKVRAYIYIYIFGGTKFMDYEILLYCFENGKLAILLFFNFFPLFIYKYDL